ncbi:MAG: hypothetical protein HC884_19085 [Chloroflexaceae bacterium]|nr:hypothetical protein [Chloroflexaceae bacterium]
MRTLLRTLLFSLFTLMEYVRSGRLLFELVATPSFFYVFLMNRWDQQRADAEHFFTLTSIFTLVITLYTMSSIINLGDRPQCYLILAGRLGRSSYLMGLYLSAFTIITGVYLLVSGATIWLSAPEDLTLRGWVVGSVPLLLNAGLLMAFLLIISPLVFPAGWRLFFLGLVALAFSRNFISGPVEEAFPPMARSVLSGLQTILSWPLVPGFSGFALALSHELSVYALIVMTAQGSLLVALLGLALYAFSQRELIFSGE